MIRHAATGEPRSGDGAPGRPSRVLLTVVILTGLRRAALVPHSDGP